MGVGQFNVANFTEGQTAKISINFINSGKRPASASVAYGVVISPSLQQFPIISAARESSVAFILPGGSFGSTFDYDVPFGAFAQWKSGHQQFFVVAEILYTDVGTNSAHITRYCAYYAADNKNQPFPLCTRYNEAK